MGTPQALWALQQRRHIKSSSPKVGRRSQGAVNHGGDGTAPAAQWHGHGHPGLAAALGCSRGCQGVSPAWGVGPGWHRLPVTPAGVRVPWQAVVPADGAGDGGGGGVPPARGRGALPQHVPVQPGGLADRPGPHAPGLRRRPRRPPCQRPAWLRHPHVLRLQVSTAGCVASGRAGGTRGCLSPCHSPSA